MSDIRIKKLTIVQERPRYEWAGGYTWRERLHMAWCVLWQKPYTASGTLTTTFHDIVLTEEND